MAAETSVAIKDLKLALPPGGDRAYAVDDVSFDLTAGKILCVVGESGSGKSMCAHALMGLLPDTVIAEAGEIAFEGRKPPHAGRGQLACAARPPHRHGVSGADDGAEPVDADRRPDRRDVRGA